MIPTSSVDYAKTSTKLRPVSKTVLLPKSELLKKSKYEEHISNLWRHPRLHIYSRECNLQAKLIMNKI
jgi:hypothetical protein